MVSLSLQGAVSPTSFPGLFPVELGRREKTLASAGHVPILHPKIQNFRRIHRKINTLKDVYVLAAVRRYIEDIKRKYYIRSE